jgi:hypothetical protein
MTLDWTKGGVGTTGAEEVKIIAKDWFAAQEHRTPREVPPRFTRKLTKRRKVPKDLGTCHADAKEELGKAECGRGLFFGATNYELVVVTANSEKCPAKQCRLYDDATKKYTAVPGISADDAEAPTLRSAPVRRHRDDVPRRRSGVRRPEVCVGRQAGRRLARWRARARRELSRSRHSVGDIAAEQATRRVERGAELAARIECAPHLDNGVPVLEKAGVLHGCRDRGAVVVFPAGDLLEQPSPSP